MCVWWGGTTAFSICARVRQENIIGGDLCCVTKDENETLLDGYALDSDDVFPFSSVSCLSFNLLKPR